MKQLLCFCAAMAAMIAMGAARDLPLRDSSTFDFKYEMEAQPATEDLDGDGLADLTINGGSDWLTIPNNTGYAIFECSQANRFIRSEADNGAEGCIWRKYGVTAQTGYTIETRLRVTAETAGTTAAFCLQASVPDSTVHALLNFRTNMVMWGNTVLTNMNTQSTFHTYRLARAPGTATFSVWCDGKLLAENLGNGLSYGTLNRILIGSLGGNWKGGARVAYLRFTKGGYAPKQTEKDSSEFAHKYEMDSADTRFSATATTSDWKHFEGAQGTAVLADGILSVSQPNGKMRYYQTVNPMDSSIANSSPFTIETKVRITASWNVTLPVLNFFCGTPRAAGSLFIGANGVCWYDRYNVIYPCDNTDKAHIFRLTYDGDTDYGFSVWRDGVKIGENLPCYQMTSSYNFARFGIASTSTHGGSFEIDYIRWTTDGVFAPYVPPAGTIVIFK